MINYTTIIMRKFKLAVCQNKPGFDKEKNIKQAIDMVGTAAANAYPLPVQATKQLTPMEIGMIGLGIVVLSFAIITLANLILE